MTHLDVSNSSTDSSSGSTSDSSSSESSSSSSGSGSSSSDSDSSTSDTPAVIAPPPPKSPVKVEEPKKKEEPKRRLSKVKVSSSSEDDTPKSVSPKPTPPRRRASTKSKPAAAVLAKGKAGQSRLPAGARTPKPIPKTIQKATKAETASHKKKSIFSPDNSSESETESKSSSKSPKGSSSPKSKRSSRKSSEEKDISTPPAVDIDDSNSNSNNSNSNNSNSNNSTNSNSTSLLSTNSNAESRISNAESRISNAESRISNSDTHISITDSRISNSESSKSNSESRNSNSASRNSNTASRNSASRNSNTGSRNSNSTTRTSNSASRNSNTASRNSNTKSRNSTTTSRNSNATSRNSASRNSNSNSLSNSTTISNPSSNSTTNSNSSKDSKDNVKRKSGNKANGPPPKKSIEDKSASSCSSSQSSVESVSSDSDSEPTITKESLRTGKSKPPSTTSSTSTKQETTTTGKSGDSGDSLSGTMTRKLTRSLSARVSRLAQARPAHTDTDSEVEDKPSAIEKSKKSNLIKSRNYAARSPVPAPANEPVVPTERKCPVRGCDSSGHLGGKSARHFTFDACPVYHNVSAAWCVAGLEERAAAAAARRRALHAMAARARPVPSLDQRAYQLKVKDMRSKWKGSQELKEKLAASGNDEMTEDREPILDGFAPDYDLKLFREAQALAAIKIEEELGDLPTDRGTRYVVMGKYMMEVWYQSPYPGEAARAARLFVCEFCLQHHRSGPAAASHRAKCVWRHPPGDEVYRHNDLSVWQVDGRKHKQYCQQLCLLAKFFLDHKTLYYDVEPFLFYVMTCTDKEGCHIVGYFSKEKNSFQNYNVSCILTLPPYQRQGYGRLLIDFSYLLTKVEGKVGSPETPLSDLGLISYRSYWKEALLKRLCSAPGPTLCIRDLSKDLAIASSDIVSTLQERGLMKYWKGKHIVLKKQEVLDEASRRAARARSVEASCLRWWGAPAPR